ncbi:tetratricopeptide repeat protein [Petrachloros mirabilis]
MLVSDRILAGVVLLLVSALVACESKVTSESEEVVNRSSQERTAQTSMSKEGVATATEVGLLVAPATSLARATNDEGVQQGQQGHWDVAEKVFRKAIDTDDNLAEAQFNLGVVLDKQGKHDEAVKAFKKAAQLAPTNKLITESDIVKKHKNS